MLDSLWSGLKCASCDIGALEYSSKDTFEAYSEKELFVLDDIETLIGGLIANFLIFKCGNCGTEYRYTYKDIDKIVRKDISNRVMTMYATGEIIGATTPSKELDRVFVYCGKCNGYDGKGSCLLKIFDECKLKRLPYGL
jgi:hypothetical protein